MAGTTTNSRPMERAGASTHEVIIQHNKLVDDLETLRAKFAAVLTKMDADAGITDTNYSALHTVAAATLTAAKVGNEAGTAITT